MDIIRCPPNTLGNFSLGVLCIEDSTIVSVFHFVN
jgi:hypothetical protein